MGSGSSAAKPHAYRQAPTQQPASPERRSSAQGSSGVFQHAVVTCYSTLAAATSLRSVLEAERARASTRTAQSPSSRANGCSPAAGSLKASPELQALRVAVRWSEANRGSACAGKVRSELESLRQRLRLPPSWSLDDVLVRGAGAYSWRLTALTLLHGNAADTRKLAAALQQAHKQEFTELPEYTTLLRTLAARCNASGTHLQQQLACWPFGEPPQIICDDPRGVNFVVRRHLHHTSDGRLYNNVMQEFVDACFRGEDTLTGEVYADRLGRLPPARCLVQRVEHLVNMCSWQAYVLARATLKSRMSADGAQAQTQFLTDSLPARELLSNLGEIEGDGLQKDLNETLLCHGTPPAAAQQIASSHFRLEKAGKNASVYGTGIYFAEDFVKADQYSAAGGKHGWRSMLLCRCVLGRALTIEQDIQKDENAKAQLQARAAAGEFDSLVVDRTKLRYNRYRQIILYRSDLVYPVLLLWYTHQARTASNSAASNFSSPSPCRRSKSMPHLTASRSSVASSSRVDRLGSF
eukprot:TRINITY_DN62919_c0_g1_i1.p1 TRINITY_DN62919_c0_g1~~TRINITY_DN62919_c0_g1_i1.p1  ORF type:complete len:523 (-),score=95.53 TRINITY_DN62919_c0_g1_i1:104-1672(-)